MTIKNRTSLYALTEDGDTADTNLFADLIDSALNLSDTTAQSMASELKAPKFNATTEVSAPLARLTEVSASSVRTDTLWVGGAQVQAGGGSEVGELYITATAETSIGASNTFVSAAGTFAVTPSFSLVSFSALSMGDLKYTGTIAKRLRATASFSMTAAGNSKVTAFRIAVNGSSRGETEIERWVGTGTDRGAANISCVVSAPVSATIGLRVANKTDTTNITLEKMVLSVNGV